MQIEKQFPLIDEILEPWNEQIGPDYQAYRNHLYRMVNYCFALNVADDTDQQKIQIAAAFHDLGIWAEDTVDYLDPSIALAKAYLEERRLEDWIPEISLMIELHHRFREYKDDRYPLVEVFRRADLVDVSLGAVKWGIPKEYIKKVKSTFPNEGFHKRLMQLTVRELKRNPLNPLPMMKW